MQQVDGEKKTKQNIAMKTCLPTPVPRAGNILTLLMIENPRSLAKVAGSNASP